MARETRVDDGDWWMAHVLIAIFVLLVAVILRVVPGWSAPLHVWITFAAIVDILLAAHAGARASLRAARGRWREGTGALMLAAVLVAAAALMMKAGRLHPFALEDAPVDDVSSTPATAR